MAKYIVIIVLLVAILGALAAPYVIKPAPPLRPIWQADLKAKLPILGHRNWVVIADSAYPSQSGQGVSTLYAGGNQLDAVKDVLKLISEQKHVKPSIYLDKELDFVPEEDALGVGQYIIELKKSLGDLPVSKDVHESIIKRLDEDGKLFNVVIMKTDLTIPYTSVFINLDCAYWDDEKQAKLKKAMSKK